MPSGRGPARVASTRNRHRISLAHWFRLLDQRSQRPPRRDVRRELPGPHLRRVSLRDAGRLNDLGQAYALKSREDLAPEQDSGA